MNAEELRRLRADITYAMDLRHTYLDREETRWRILETVVSKPFRAFLDERSNQLQVIERDRLARALAEVEHAAGCTTDQYAVDLASRRGYQFGHPVTAHLPAMLRKADAIIRALDSTTGDERG